MSGPSRARGSLSVAAVLVVDDEPDILLLHRLNLEAAGHEVVLAADGDDARSSASPTSGPTSCVLDVMMPVLDGWGVLERLGRTESPRPGAGRVGQVGACRRRPAPELGAADYLAKPFDAEALLSTIAGLVASLPAAPSAFSERRSPVYIGR